MEKLANTDFEKLLQLKDPWRIEEVSFDNTSRIDIKIKYDSSRGICPQCSSTCKLHDRRTSREWRHLNTMEYETYINCCLPRVKCVSCHKILTISIPWSESRNGFTLKFENYAIDILRTSWSVEEARKLLNINWHQLNGIKKRAVNRGLTRRQSVTIKNIGIDEKSYAKGHTYTSILNDLDNSRVIDLVEGKKQEDTKKLIMQGLKVGQRSSVDAVAIDMYKGYQSAIEEVLPEAKIVHDKFHISKHLNEAVDKTRRREHKMLLRDFNESLSGLRYEFLKNSESLDPELLDMFKEFEQAEYKTAIAWQLKELFRFFWKYKYRNWAKKFFYKWYDKVISSELFHVKKVAEMIKKRLPNVLNYFNYRITNAKSEGLNSKIQTVQSNSRGFRSFENLRVAVLFYCGKLDMKHEFPL